MRRGRAGQASVGARRSSHRAKAENIRSAFATAGRYGITRRAGKEGHTKRNVPSATGPVRALQTRQAPSPHVWIGRASLQKLRSALASCGAS